MRSSRLASATAKDSPPEISAIRARVSGSGGTGSVPLRVSIVPWAVPSATV
jgi:hypothetical protein